MVQLQRNTITYIATSPTKPEGDNPASPQEHATQPNGSGAPNRPRHRNPDEHQLTRPSAIELFSSELTQSIVQPFSLTADPDAAAITANQKPSLAQQRCMRARARHLLLRHSSSPPTTPPGQNCGAPGTFGIRSITTTQSQHRCLYFLQKYP